jgi:hypothetical protein
MHISDRFRKWAKVSMAGLAAGFCFGSGCSLDGLVIRVDDDDDDDVDNIFDFFEERWEDREDFWDHVF